MSRGRPRSGAFALAGLLLSKQYVAGLLPFLWPVLRRWGARATLAGLALAAVVLAIFVAADPGGFWRDAVLLHLKQPYRPDSMSLLVEVANRVGRPPSWLLGVAPLGAGLVASAIVARRLPAGATAVALCWGLGLLATVLLSKQAHQNYYFLIQGALAMAIVTWPTDGPGSDTAEGVDTRNA